MPWRDAHANDADPELFLTREWLLTNGLGVTRPAPFPESDAPVPWPADRLAAGAAGRIVMLSQLSKSSVSGWKSCKSTGRAWRVPRSSRRTYLTGSPGKRLPTGHE